MDKILVTGGCGFIGSSFIRRVVNNEKVHVTNVDILTYSGNPKNLASIEDSERYTFAKVDIRDRDSIFNLCKDVNYIVNFAAESHVDRSILEPEIFISTNILGTSVLLDAANEFGCRMVQVSTDEVYGSLNEDSLPSKESDYLLPSSPYSSSKASADLICLSYFKTFDTDISITRCTNNYGPYQYPEKLIPTLISKALNNDPLPLYGDGRNIRDWIFVDDHSNAIWNVLLNGNAGKIYNVGGDNQRRNIEISQIILDILGDRSSSKIKYIKDRPGHDWRYAVDDSVIKSELNWSPQTSFESGIKSTIEWYINNEEWWRPLIK